VVPATRKKTSIARPEPSYDAMLSEVVGLIEAARRASTRAVNALMTAAGSWSRSNTEPRAPATVKS